MVRYPEADILPREAELPLDVFDRRIVGWIVQAPEPLCRILAETRILHDERGNELLPILGELAKEPRDFTVEPADCLQFRRRD